MMYQREDTGEVKGTRKEDESSWFIWATRLQKYAILWIPILWLSTALGFGYFTPAQKTEEIKRSIETVKFSSDSNKRFLQSEVDSLRYKLLEMQNSQNKILEGVGILKRLGCADPKISLRDKIIAGLDC